jgi:hypothetical protein
MKQFVLDGDVVKRLMYKEPIIEELYEHNGLQWDFTNWYFNTNQPSAEIDVTKGRIVIRKFKPNEPILISNFTGNASNGTPNADDICAISKNLKINVSGIPANNQIFGDGKYYENTNRFAGQVTGRIYGLGFLLYSKTQASGRPLDMWGELPFSCYVWEGITMTNGTWVQMGSDTSALRSDIEGAYNRYGKNFNYNDTKILPDWRTFYTESYMNKDFQLSIGLYTNVQTDNDGFIELQTPITISLIASYCVDPTTQEAFKLYRKNELLYERDRNIENLYKVYNLLKEDRTCPYKSQWQRNLEDGTPLGYNLQYIFDRSDYDYQKITIPVATDLVQAINDEMPLKFAITQFDIGRNKFWETIVRAINQKTIDDVVFCYHLFKNAKGLSELDWQTIGDSTLHGIVINLGSGYPYVMNQCFYGCDVPAVTINCQGTLNDLGDTFAYCDAKHIKIGQGITIRILSGAFEATTKLESLEGLVVGNKQNLVEVNGVNCFLSYDTISLQYSFESTNLQTLSLSGEDMIVYPYCPQMFGYYNYQTKLKTVTGVALDFRLVNPNDIYNWGVRQDYEHPIFGRAIIESIQIKNLNKGNWTIPLPLDDTSVIYLLNNIYDLTSNDGEHLERDDNSFNGWGHSYTNQETHKTIRFNHGHYAQITKTNWTGRKIFKLQANVATQISLMLKDQGTIVLNQQFNIGTSETIIDRSANTFDEVRIGINLQNSQNDVVLILSDPFDSAASTTTSATLTLSGVQYKADFDTAIATAQAKGWTVNFAS